MSLEALEKVLYDLNVDRAAKERFRQDAERYLSRFQLTEIERGMVRAFDVRGLAGRGVNVMLTMGFWMELHGSRDLGAYVACMRSGTASGDATHG